MLEIVIAFIISVNPITGDKFYWQLDPLEYSYCYRLAEKIQKDSEFNAVCYAIYQGGVDV